jgi:hypothetical protein
MGDRKPYPSDVTDEQWALIGPFLNAWKAKRVSVSRHQGDYDLRDVEGARAKLKRLVSRQILTETEPGIFALAPKRT